MVTKSVVVKVDNAKIVSVEPGNIRTLGVDVPYIAFSTDEEISDKKIKVVLKGNLAKVVWFNFLDEHGTMNLEKTSFEHRVKRSVLVSFEGLVKEERSKEILISEIKSLKFSYCYEILN